MSYELTQAEVDGERVTYVRFPHLKVPHGSSTRLGGVSQGSFASLNLGYSSGDQREAVDANRGRFGQALGFQVPPVLKMEHGVEVAVIDEVGPDKPRADACITNRPGVALSVTTADCVPVLFHDPVKQVVGVAHAGWRGTVGGIAGKTVEAMQRTYESRPQDLQVALAPAIGPRHFLVDEDVAGPFEQRFGGQDFITKRANKWAIDLWEANRVLLLQMGVPAGQVYCCDLCTYEREDLFFSYRRDGGKTGRLVSALMLGGG